MPIKFLAPPVFADDEEKTRVAGLLNAILLISLSVSLAFAVVAFFSSPDPAFSLVATGSLALLQVAALFLMRAGRVRLATILFSSLLWLGVTGVAFSAGGVRSASFTIYTIVILIAGMLLGWRAALVFIGLSVASGLGMLYAERTGFLPEPRVSITSTYIWVTQTVSFIVAAALLYLATRDIRGALERVRSSERALVQSNIELQNVRASLEQRVADRTRYLEAAAEVSRAAASVLSAEQLIQQSVEWIRAQFGLYHVGLFLVDETGEWAVLEADTGEAGSVFLARGQRLMVEGGSPVGWSIVNAQARVVREGDVQAVHLGSPELPDARSEAVLPMRSRGRVVGALVVQSDQPDFFDSGLVAVLQTMADQVALSLDNARLFAESQEALEATRRAYGELSSRAWAELLRGRADWGYRYSELVSPAKGDWRPEMRQAARTGRSVQGDGAEGPSLAVPVKVRDQVVGVLGFSKGVAGEAWTAEEVALLETLAGQLGLALESARLYQDTQRVAARERLTREITDRMRRASGVEDIVQTALDELSQALGTSRTFVRLGLAPSMQDDKEETRQSAGG